MRITKQQADSIKQLVAKVFGRDSEVYLFGSRARDDLTGGDIDLYVKASEPGGHFQKKLRLTSELQMALGDQRFDIVVASRQNRLIERQAAESGIRL